MMNPLLATSTCFPATLSGLPYAQAQKIYHRQRLLRVNHQMFCDSVEAFTVRLKARDLPGRIQTAFIERVNLTHPILHSLRSRSAVCPRRRRGGPVPASQSRPLLVEFG